MLRGERNLKRSAIKVIVCSELDRFKLKTDSNNVPELGNGIALGPVRVRLQISLSIKRFAE